VVGQATMLAHWAQKVGVRLDALPPPPMPSNGSLLRTHVAATAELYSLASHVLSSRNLARSRL